MPGSIDDGFSQFRIGGTDRYETAALIASFGMSSLGMNANRIAIATGENYPDALAAGPLQAKVYGVLMLTRPTSLPGPQATVLPNLKESICEVRWMGSTSAIGPGVRSTVSGLLY